MGKYYTKEDLRKLFQSPFNAGDWKTVLTDFFKATEYREEAELIQDDTVNEGYYLGNIQTPDSYSIGFFRYRIKNGSVVRKRVGLRSLVKSYINTRYGEFDAALVVFDSGDHWRLSFICDIKGEETAPKRYTYVFGNSGLLYKTAVGRFYDLQNKGISKHNIEDTFSVEALSDEFFDKYREKYANFVQYITGKRSVKEGNKWVDKQVSDPNTELMKVFGNDEKKVRDYIKKMMGRITFLHFLQRKGWMNGDLNYMQNLFKRSSFKDDYLDSVLEPLFFGILNTIPSKREALFRDSKWDLYLLAEWKDIPYLNGGLFERDNEDVAQCRFPSDYFKSLFQFFSEYNFTIDENDPNDAEIGVDPEMLGKIFENLLEDNKDKGAFYTPKEIVRYMCKESLIAFLENNTSIASEKIRQFVLSPEDNFAVIPNNRKAKLLEVLENVKICDPALGSGAFPMGLLNELLNCREALTEGDIDRVELKKSIIQNNIYGVDIEKGAVDIARLRFWLSIVVDENSPSPLPNLDYKIMQGNSLLESYKGVDLSQLTYEKERKNDKVDLSLFDDDKNRLQKVVSLLLKNYYSCSDHEKKIKIQQEIANAINDQLETSNIDQVILNELKSIDMAGNNHFFLWHTWFSEVFNRKHKKGFDIVIGNPPFGADIDDIKSVYYKKYKKVIEKYAEIYKIFFAHSFDISCPDAVVCLITPNTFLSQPRYSDLRSVLIEKRFLKVVNLGENVFEAIVPTSITIMQNSSASNFVYFDCSKNSSFFGLNVTNGKSICVERVRLNKEYNLIPTETLKEGMVSFEDVFCIKDAGIQYHRSNIGLKNKGGNDLYERIFTDDATKFNQSIPTWYGKLINRYYIKEQTNEYFDLNYKGSLRSNESVSFSVESFKKSPKLIWRQTADRIRATIDYEGRWFRNTIQCAYLKDEYVGKYDYLYLLGLLNSEYIRFCYDKIVRENGRVFPQVKITHLKKLPFVTNVSDEYQNTIKELVNSILAKKKMNEKNDTVFEEKEIDKIIYKIYGLSEEAIKEVEDCAKK